MGRPAPREDYASTYYPNELDAAHAVPVDVGVGSELRGVDIQVRRERVYSIRGKVTGSSTKDFADYRNLTIVRRNEKAAFRSEILHQVQIDSRDGTFESPYLFPGTYVLHVGVGYSGSMNGGLMLLDRPSAVNGNLAGRMEVSIRDADVEGVVLELRPALEISGTIEVESNNPADMPRPTGPAQLGQLQVGLSEIDGLNGGGAVQPKSDGTFQLGWFEPARYLVGVENCPEGLYVKSVRFGAQDVLHAPLGLTSGGGGTLEILLGKSPAEVIGTTHILDSDQRQSVSVALWPVVPELGRRRTVRSVYAGGEGTFQFKDLAPGEYYLAAWEEVEYGLAENPDFRASVQREASKFTVQRGSRLTMDVDVIPRDRIAAEVAKFR